MANQRSRDGANGRGHRQSQGHTQAGPAELLGDGLEKDTVGIKEKTHGDEVDEEGNADHAPAEKAGGVRWL
jgi:hypothetical protein